MSRLYYARTQQLVGLFTRNLNLTSRIIQEELEVRRALFVRRVELCGGQTIMTCMYKCLIIRVFVLVLYSMKNVCLRAFSIPASVVHPPYSLRLLALAVCHLQAGYHELSSPLITSYKCMRSCFGVTIVHERFHTPNSFTKNCPSLLLVDTVFSAV